LAPSIKAAGASASYHPSTGSVGKEYVLVLVITQVGVGVWAETIDGGTANSRPIINIAKNSNDKMMIFKSGRHDRNFIFSPQ
jgi:hypothetical protein